MRASVRGCSGSHLRFDPGDRFETDPVAWLGTWEHQTLERLLKWL